jgi:putative transposase
VSAVLAPLPARLLLPTQTQADPWLRLGDAQREEALRLHAFLLPALDRVKAGELSERKAAEWLYKTRRREYSGNCSASSIARWLADYRRGGLPALAPQYKGRIRKVGGWEARALMYRRLPSCPSYATIAGWLVADDGFDAADATATRVQRFLESLPKDQTDYAAERVGPHFRRLNLTPKKIRDRSVVPVGMLYQGDGHSTHYYVRHPNSGHHISAELTPWMDIGSRYIAGWWLGYVESAVQTLYSLSHAILSHDHVPGMLHVDPGSGFKNRAICDAVSGFAPRLGIDFMTALPGNAPGKGDIEGWFKHFEERHGKKQPSYKGKEVPQEFLRNLEKRIERGQMYVPTWEEALDGIRRYVQRYNETNQDDLGGVSPARLWEQLDRKPLHLPPTSLVRPREIRVARSYDVAVFNRVYRANELKAYEGEKVQVEYNLHDDGSVALYDLRGRFIAAGVKVKETPFLSQSRIEDLALAQERAALKRLEAKADIVRANHREPISAAAMLDALDDERPAITHEQSPMDLLLTGRMEKQRERAPRRMRAVDAEDARIVEAVIAEQSAPVEDETPVQRFARWLGVQAAVERGDASVEDTAWADIYEQSAEFLGQNDVYQAFGTLPGLPKAHSPNERGSAATEPL